ncbi:TPA: hypothetical protein ACS61X_004278 [Klebsiella pneumoniae]
MTKSTITIERLEKIKSWRETYGAGSNVMLPAEEAEALALIALAAMDSEHKRNPVLAYADSYRDMAKQGVESVPIWSVITDLERNIAPLYRHAQPAPVSMKDHQIRELVNELRDIAIECHGTQQLRERIARTVRAAMLSSAQQVDANALIPVVSRNEPEVK